MDHSRRVPRRNRQVHGSPEPPEFGTVTGRRSSDSNSRVSHRHHAGRSLSRVNFPGAFKGAIDLNAEVHVHRQLAARGVVIEKRVCLSMSRPGRVRRNSHTAAIWRCWRFGGRARRREESRRGTSACGTARSNVCDRKRGKVWLFKHSRLAYNSDHHDCLQNRSWNTVPGYKEPVGHSIGRHRTRISNGLAGLSDR